MDKATCVSPQNLLSQSHESTGTKGRTIVSQLPQPKDNDHATLKLKNANSSFNPFLQINVCLPAY
jgi:hypothetical protein